MPVAKPLAGCKSAQDILRSVLASDVLKAEASRFGVGVQEARSDPLNFLRYTTVDETNTPIKIDTFTRIFCEAWHACFKQGRHLSFTAPPGLGKSTLARMLILRHIGRNPVMRTVIISADEAEAKNAVSLCREIVLSNPYREVYPEVQPDISRTDAKRGWVKNEWYLVTSGQRKDPTMRSSSATPTAESKRVDLLLADDIVTEQNSEGVRHASVCNAFFKTWIEGRCKPAGWACYLQNIRNTTDLLHRLRHSPKFCSVWVTVTPSRERMCVRVWNPPHKLHFMEFPERYGLEVGEADDGTENPPVFYAEFALPDRQGWDTVSLSQIEPAAFRTLYLGRGNDPADLLFPSWSKRVTFNGTAEQALECGSMAGLPEFNHTHRLRYRMCGGVDISSSKRRGMAFFLLAVDSTGTIRPVEHWCIAGSVHSLVSGLNAAWARGLYWDVLYVENNGVQDVILDVVRVMAEREQIEWAGTILPYHTGKNKWDATLGLPSLDVDFANQKVVWPLQECRKQMAHARDWMEFETQMSILTKETTRESTPDGLMAYWFARSGLRNMIRPGRRDSGAKSGRIHNADSVAGRF